MNTSLNVVFQCANKIFNSLIIYFCSNLWHKFIYNCCRNLCHFFAMFFVVAAVSVTIMAVRVENFRIIPSITIWAIYIHVSFTSFSWGRIFGNSERAPFKFSISRIIRSMNYLCNSK